MDRESQGVEELNSPTKKRGLVLFRNILIFLLLLSGVVCGLRISGGLTEIFETVSPVMAQVPFVGEPLVALMDSLERPLNVRERRSLELKEMESVLLAREEALHQEMKELEADRTRVDKLREELEKQRKTLEQEGEMPTKPDEPEVLANLVRGFEDMSSRKAAGIISRLSRSRAMEIMKALSQGKMAEILAKMEPATAAKMVEALSQEGARAASQPN